MANKDFVVKNGLVTGTNTTSIGTAAYVTATGNVGIGNSAPTNKLSVNGDVYLGNTTFSGFANATTSVSVGTSFVANTTGAYHTGTINAASHTVGTSTIANATGVYAGIVNATTLSTGTVNVLNASGLATSANVSIGAGGELILTAGAGVYANGSLGSALQVLHSNGSSVYWGADNDGVTSVASGNGLTGGPITTTGTLSVVAGTGTVVNATGVHVNATYIGTISANNTTYVNTKTEGNLNVNNSLTANNSSYLNSKAEAALNVNNATYCNGKAESNLNVNNALTANSSSYLGSSSAASYQLNSTLSANVATLSANNSSYLGGTAAASYQLNSTLSANVATLTANNANNLGGSAAALYAKLAGPAFTGNTTFASYHYIDSNGGVYRTGAGNYGVRIIPGGGTDTTVGILQFTDSTGATQLASVYANSTIMGLGGDTVATNLRANGSVVVNLTSSGAQITSLGVGAAPSGTAGEIRANNNITAYYSSDASLKTNVKNIPNALAKVCLINGVEFDWTDAYIEEHGGEDGYFVRKHDVGVIAQELEVVLPEVVVTRSDGTKAVKYDRVVSLLIEAIKDLKAEIDELKRGK